MRGRRSPRRSRRPVQHGDDARVAGKAGDQVRIGHRAAQEATAARLEGQPRVEVGERGGIGARTGRIATENPGSGCWVMTFRSWNERGRAVRAKRTDRRDRMARHTAACGPHCSHANRQRGRGRRRHPVRPADLRPLAARRRRRSCSTRSSRERRSSATSASSTSTPRARRRTWRRRWRRTSATAPCSSAPNARAAVNEGRADYVPIFLSDVPSCSRAASCRSMRCCSTSRRPDAHGYCSLGTSVDASIAAIRAARRRSSPSSTRRCPARSATRSSTSTRSTRRSRWTAAVRARVAADRRRRATHRRARRRARPRRGDAPDGDRLDPGGGGARAPRQARPRRPHRAVHRCGLDLVEAGAITGAREGEQPRQDRDGVPDGHASACTTSSTTTR